MANIDTFRDAVMEHAIEEIRVACFEHVKSRRAGMTEWRQQVESILARLIEDYR